MSLILFLSNIENAYIVIVSIFSIGQLISSLEFIFIRKEFSDVGAFPWKILRFEHQRYLSSNIRPAISGLFSYGGVLTTLVIRIVALVAILFTPINSLQFTICVVIIVATLIIMHSRQVYGGEGSDQMSLIISICLLTGGGIFMNHGYMAQISLFFLAAQSCLSYTAAGIAKLISPKWRSGYATFEIFNTASHGSLNVASFLSKNRALSYTLSWSAILFESSFAVCLISPWPVLLSILTLGIIFHFVNAIVMGLNSFLWIFVATYPAIIYTAASIHQL